MRVIKCNNCGKKKPEDYEKNKHWVYVSVSSNPFDGNLDFWQKCSIKALESLKPFIPKEEKEERYVFRKR